MPDMPMLRSVEVDLAANTLRLLLSPDCATTMEPGAFAATIDIGAGGRLIGVETPGGYIDVMSPMSGTEHLVRSASARANVERLEDANTPTALVVARAGEGYEITYPSGNQ